MTFPSITWGEKQAALKAAPTTLYRFYGDDGELLYAGISVNACGRISNHSHGAWWDQVRFATFEHFDSRALALRAESAAILEEHPRHNLDRTDKRTTPSGEIVDEVAA